MVSLLIHRPINFFGPHWICEGRQFLTHKPDAYYSKQKENTSRCQLGNRGDVLFRGSFASAEELLQTKTADIGLSGVGHLPGLSGLQLTRLLIGSGRAKPIIFITGQDEPSLRDEAQCLGCAYFRKPFEGKELLEAIRTAVTVDFRL